MSSTVAPVVVQAGSIPGVLVEQEAAVEVEQEAAVEVLEAVVEVEKEAAELSK